MEYSITSTSRLDLHTFNYG